MNEFNDKVKRILKDAEKEMFDLNHPYVGSEHLLLSLLRLDTIKDICSKYDLTYEIFKDELLNIVGKSNIKSNVVLYTPLLRKILDTSIKTSKKRNIDIDEKLLLEMVLASDEGIALRVIDYLDIDINSLYNDITSKVEESVLSIGEDLNKRKSQILIGRDKEINSLIEILLRKKKNNPILIGEAGVGKSSIVYELARRIESGCVPSRLKNKRIISLDMSSLLSNTKYRGEFESKINNLIKEVKSKNNIILFIDEIHTIVKSGGSEGSIDCANMLKPYLASDDIKVIGATTISEYDKYISSDKALSRRFEKVIVNEPSYNETIDILNGVKSEYEDYYNISISEANIIDIIDLSNKYIKNKCNPDKSLDVLDNVLIKLYLNDSESLCNHYLKYNDFSKALDLKIKSNKRCIKRNDILSVIENMTGIKLLNNNDYKRLVNTLNTSINEDISGLKKCLKDKFNSDSVYGLMVKNNIYDVHKLIADELKYNLIELDMNEFSLPNSISKIIGVDKGYSGYDDISLLDKIKYHPYSLLYLNNIDKADIGVINIFKSILKKGVIKNNKDEDINFNNVFIIMSSDNIKNNIGFNNSYKRDDALIDNVIEFNNVYQK